MEKDKKSFKIKKIHKKKKKRYIRLQTILSAAFCFETLALGFLLYPIIMRKSDHIETLKRIEASVDIDKITVYRRLLYALKANKYLGEAEREYIIDNLDSIIEYKDYIDIDYLEEMLYTLKVTYRKNKNKGNSHTRTKGEYSHYRNEIVFFGVDNIDELDITTFNHELYHVIQKDYYKERNEYLIESINTIFNEDNSEAREKTIYSSYYNYTKMLMEIIGVEPFCRYQGYCTSEPIVNELVNIYGTEKDAKELLADMDEYKYMYDEFASKNSLGVKKNSKKLEAKNKKIIDQIGVYYENKFGFSMENDLIMLYYYDHDKFHQEVANKFFIEGSITSSYEENNIKYFKNSCDSSLIVTTSGLVETINVRVDDEENISEDVENKCITYVIDDSNRYINNVVKKTLHK